jgi:hypothetical protein
MRVDIATHLDRSASTVWNEVQTSALLLQVVWPLLRLVPVHPATFPERWSEGITIRCKPFMFGFIPLGVHTLHFERIDQANYEIQTREADPLIRRWDHLVSVKSLGENQSIYRDTIDIDAGRLTFIVWAWAVWLYRYRQRRWRMLAKSLGQ